MKLPTQAVSAPEFSDTLNDAVSAIRAEAEAAPNEATAEAAFERYLFLTLRAVGTNYAPIKEARINGTLLRTTGRADSRFRQVLIEFKHKSELKTPAQIAKHLTQLVDYMQALAPEVEGDQVGFLTDGITYVRVVYTTDGTVAQSAPAPFDEEGLRLVCRAIIASGTSALSAENLVRDFCGSVSTGHLFIAARALLATITSSSTLKTEMLHSEWQSLFRLAHEDTSQQARIQARRESLSNIFQIDIDDASLEYMCLFCIHTSYAIIVKLIAYKVVSDALFGTVLQDYKDLLGAKDPTVQAFCAAMEDGDLFRQVGILNLLEGDFFSWYADDRQWNKEIAKCIRDILHVLARYEDARNLFSSDRAVDLFRSLYESAIPQVVRGSFGEFYTPLWLAQHVLEDSGFKDGDRVLDPCCGSGTFLVAALQEVRSQSSARNGSKAQLNEILGRVSGIDLNPLAVLTARIHYFLYIADLVKRDGDPLVIPVFLGDASYVPSVVELSGSKFVTYELRTLKTPLEICLPLSFVQDSASLFSVMNDFESVLAEGDYSGAQDILRNYCTAAGLKAHETAPVLKLGEQIAELERKEWNGIWSRIIANFASTVSIGQFERIVGNPPWIDWKSLPAGYRETVKGLCLSRGLFSGDGRTGGINLNICALIAHVSATNWLAKEGTLSFLMPRELAVQPSYEGWRRSVGGAECAIAEFHDWSNAGHPFEPVREDFMTFVLKKGKNPSDVIVYDYSRTERRDRPWLWTDLEDARPRLRRQKRFARPLVKGRTGFTFADTKEQLDTFALVAGECDYIGREGIEFYPQELVMFRYLEPGPKTGTVWVENFQGVKSKYRIPKQKLILETKFLFPLAKGPMIKEFEYQKNDLLVAFPYHSADPMRPIDRARLRQESPLLLKYFLKYEKELSAQTAYSDSIRAKGEFYGLARTGPYSFASNYVGYRDNTSWSACVLSTRKMPWGERKRYLFQNHAASICERGDRAFIDVDEAHYVCAIFNSDVVEEYIYACSDNRSFKVRPPIFVPRYDPAKSRHVALAALSKDAHDDPAKRSAAKARASTIYLQLCKLDRGG